MSQQQQEQVPPVQQQQQQVPSTQPSMQQAQQPEGTMTQQPQQQRQQGGRRQRRARMSPEAIAVIVNGWPNQMAVEVAQACKKRGYHVVPCGLAMDDVPGATVDVPEVGQIKLHKFSDPNSKEALMKGVEEARQQEKYLVVVDASPNAPDHVKLYNELQIPFILQTKGGEAHTKAVRETEAARTTAMITEVMNKHLTAFDSMWHEWSRRFPGLFDDFDLTFRSTVPEMTPRGLLNSFSDLVNRDFQLEDVQRMSPGEEKNMGFTEGHLSREYSFKDGSGNASFTFRQSVNNDKEFAESAADSVAFLAQKSQEIARPQVYNILDVAQQGRFLTW